MTRTCILHIGSHKTGTSAIQRAFRGFDDGKLRYAELGDHNHSRALQLMFCDRFRNRAEKDLPEEMFESYIRADLFRSLDAQLADGSRDMLISGEELSRSFSAVDVARFVDYIQPYFACIRALGYAREPYDVMRSSYQQALRAGFPKLKAASRYQSYRGKFEMWDQQLGVGNVSLYCYDRRAFPSGSAVADFAQKLDVDPPTGTKRSTNEALTSDAFSVLFAYRQIQRRNKQRRDPVFDRPLIRLLARLPSEPFDFAHSVWAPAIQENQDDIAWIEARMGRAFPAPSQPRPGTIVFSDAKMIIRYAREAVPRVRHWLRWRCNPLRPGRAELRQVLHVIEQDS